MPTTNAISNRFYPQLSDVITVDDLPDFLDFAKDGLSSFLSSVHYKNLQYSKGQRGDSASYKIDIISNNIGLDLPFGLRLVLNPDASGDNSISSFPVTLQYQWQILSFLRSFNLPSVSFDVDGLFQLGLQIFKVTDQQVIAHILNFFVTPANTSTTQYQQILTDINTLFPTANLTIPTGQTPTVNLIAQLITQNTNIPKSISEVLFAIYIASDSTKLQQFFNLIVPGGIDNYIQKLITPSVKASLTLSAGIEFPTNILQPVDATGKIIPNEKSVFQFAEATFTVDSTSGIGSQLELGGSLIPQYAQIGNSGLIVSLTNAKLDLSKTTNIPEATAAGYAVDWVGLYIQQASISFSGFGTDDTTKVSASISANNLFIGTGGVSGTIKLADSGILYRNFGNFAVELDTFALTFKQGAITNSSISGKLTLPSGFNDNGTPSTILIDVAIKDSGDFAVTAKVQGTLPSFTLPNVFTLSIRSLSVGETAGRFYISVAGTLDFICNVPGLGQVMPKGIIINKLTIWDDGSIEFEGGGITVPKAFKLAIGPVKLEVSHLSIGSHTRQLNGVARDYYYFGFDGMINTGNAGVDAAGNGIKYYFTHDDGPDKPFDSYLSIDSLAIDITVPGDASADDATFILKGYLSMKNPDPTIPGSVAATEYTGKVSFALPQIGIAGSAAMSLQPSIPAFVVDIGLQLPVAIPIGPTGLGVYAFRGLIGQHFLPSKSAVTPALPDTATWWDYYKAKSVITKQEGIEVDKFASEQGYSLGAGVSLATDFGDGGYTLSTKVFLLLGLPDVFLIQGQASILSSRLGLDEDVDPPFSALIVFSSDSVIGDLGVNLNFLDILSVQADMEAGFFFNNAAGWYINVGKDTPASAQVQAKILNLFKGHAYLMISSQGIKAGAGISYSFNKSFGPIKLSASAFFNMGGSISFKPIQIGGFIEVGGSAGIKIGWFNISVSLVLAFAVEAPNPFNITGSLKLKVHTPWPLPNININADIGWHFNNNQAPLLVPIGILNLPDPANGYLPIAAHNILTDEIFPINYVTVDINGTVAAAAIPVPGDPSWKYNFTDATDVENVIIPLDSYIDIDLLKPVLPGSVPIGGAANQLPDGYIDMVPPQKGGAKQVKHQYEITDVSIYAWNATSSTWVPYNIYEAVTTLVNSNTGSGAVDLSQLKIGYWQFATKDLYNKIRLMSQTMFSYMNGSTTNNMDMDARNYASGDLFCYDNQQNTKVINWKSSPAGITYPESTAATISALSFTFNGIEGSVHQEPSFGAQSLLMAGGDGELAIVFPEPVAYVKLEFGDSFCGTNLNAMTVNFIETVYTPDDLGQPVAAENIISSFPLNQQNGVITYNDVTQGIDTVKLEVTNVPAADYNGDIVVGGHFKLADQYVSAGLDSDLEMDKAVMFTTLYNQSLTAAEVLAMGYSAQAGTVAQWPSDATLDSAGTLNAIISGSPESIPGFYEADTTGLQDLHQIYSYTANSDSLVIPFDPLLKVENGDFAFETTAVFNPYTAGLSTLLSKVDVDPATGNSKGFALHLLQSTPADPQATYTTVAAIPTFTILLTCYNGLSSSAIQVTESYTLDCASSMVVAQQYKRIVVSVNRTTGLVDLYIDRELKSSNNLPAELSVYEPLDAYTYLNQLSYITLADDERQTDTPTTPEDVLNEIQILNDTINNAIQPVWRPDTTFAVTITTQDRVNGSVPAGSAKTRILGFKTAGPLGHFHQYSPIYQALAAQDQADSFKLANLQFYIDYDRSFPDPQGQYNLSKPVLYHNPQVQLYFTEPYINAMYANWDSYQGLPAVQSSLQLQLLDPSGNAVTQSLVWAPVQQTTIDSSNFDTLTPEQQLIYQFNEAAALNGCGAMANPILKTLQQGYYQFPDLEPNKLYTAIFNAIYQADGNAADSVEVHRFSFLTSRYATFQDQASSYILGGTGASAQYAIFNQNVSFAASYIAQDLTELINDDPTDDPSYVLQFAGKFEKLVYGGIKLPTPEPFEYSAINLIINTDPADSTNRQILGILVYNPEPFNDPKLPAASLVDTFKLTLTKPDATVITPDQFIVSYSQNNSAIFITNSELNIPLGSIQMSFRYKQFNGTDYETVFQDYIGGPIDITPYF